MRLKRLKTLYQTTGFRLTLWYAGIFVLTSLLSFGLSFFLLYSSLKYKDREAIKDKTTDYISTYQANGMPALLAEIETEKTHEGHHMPFVRIVGPQNEIAFQSAPDNWHGFDVSQQPVPGRDYWTVLSKPDDDDLLDMFATRLDDTHTLQVGKMAEGRDELLGLMSIVFTGSSLLSLLIAFPTSLFLANRAFKPLGLLITAMRSIMQTGKIHARVPVKKSGEELDELGILFNALMDKIQLLIAKLGESLDNTAHDLRTPMTRLRNTAEVALQSDNIEDCKEALSDCMEESEQVLKILNVVMDIAEAEAGTMKLRPAKVDMAALLASVVELYRYIFEDKDIRVTVVSAEGILELEADKVRLEQVLANLLDNAVKYTPAGGSVAITAARNGGNIVVSFKDTGIGISKEDLPKIWDRLYRCDKSRSERGLGLGLSLVKAIAQAHKGSIEAASAPSGSTFTLRLPVSASL